MTRLPGPAATRRLGSALMSVLVAASVVGLTSGSAAAAEVGTLTLTPATGTDTSTVSFSTHSTSGTGCPAPTTNVSARAFGPGGWAVGIIVLGNTTSDVSTSADFTVAMSDTFNGISQSNGLPIVAGKYDIVLTCRDRLGTNVYGTMTGSIWFTSPTAFQSSDPAGQPVATPTSTGLSATPVNPAPSGAAIDLTATVTPSSAVGSVQFMDGPTALGSPVVVAGGTASTHVTGLADGMHQLTAAFTPADPQAFAASTSPAVAYRIGASGPPELGSLSLDPPTGLDISAPYMVTASTGPQKGCPVGTTNLSATAVGPGAWANGLLILGNTTNDLSTSADMKVIFSDSWQGIATSNSAPIVPGRYDITLLCRDRLNQTQFGVFTGSVWFTDPTHYQSEDPATSATRTSVAISASPAARTTVGQSLTLSAAVTPAGAVGNVQFQDSVLGTVVNVGSPVPSQGSGTATLATSALEVGMHSLSAVFQPSDPARFTTSSADPITYVVSLPSPPTRLAAASVTGDPRVGSRLTCSASFAGQVSYSYRWLRSGREIAGVSEAVHAVTAADLGYRMSCRVFAAGAGGTAVSTSPATQPVALGAAPRATRLPRIVGKLVVGRRLEARAGGWSPAANTFRYQWRRDGRLIASATGVHYRIRRADRGHKLTVVVRSVLAGYQTGRAVSPARRVPALPPGSG